MSGEQKAHQRSVWKFIPGFAVSAFFLWRTLRSIPFATLQATRIVLPAWLLVVVAGLLVGYSLRVVRWWLMMRQSGAPSLMVCGRVLLTSYAANNILPFRIGDFLRVFAYAGDLGASSSTILSTVVLERLLDAFMLVLFLVIALAGKGHVLPLVWHGNRVDMMTFAESILAACFIGLMLLLFGAGMLRRVLMALLDKLPLGSKGAKLKHWVELLFEAVLKLDVTMRLMLLLTTVTVWACEGMIFVAIAKAIGVASGARGPWLALSLSNLSYLIPSSPGAIGTFEYFARLGMTSQGAATGPAGIYALLVHVVVLFTITAAGGVAFLVHRSHRVPPIAGLGDELAALPTELP